MSTSKGPVAPPSVLTASMDEYVSRVLAKIPENRRGVVGIEGSNAGGALSVGLRLRQDITGVGFVGKERGQGWKVGGRAQFVF